MSEGAFRDVGGRALPLAWLILAVAAIGLSTLFAIVLVVARTPWVAGWLPAGQVFGTALVLHVNLASLVWFLAVACALWSLDATRRLSALRWTGFGLAAAGMVALVASPLASPGAPLLSNYVPVLESDVFRIGLAWLFAGVALTAALALPRLRRLGSADLALVPVAAAALPLLAAFASLVWSWAALPAGLDAGLYFELLSWGPGHLVQFAFTLLLMAAWLHLGRLAGLPPHLPSRRLAVGAVLFTAIVPLLALPLHALYAPDSVAFRKAFTALMSYGTWPGAAVLGAAIGLALLRHRSEAQSQPAVRPVLWLSLLLFAAGGVLGAFIRTDSTTVPAHYHGMVGAVTLALMALVLDLLPRFGFTPPGARLLRAHAWSYGPGLLLMVAGLAWSGGYGAPRKTPHTEGMIEASGHLFATALSGIGGLLAICGGVLFVVAAVGTLTRRAAPAQASAGLPAWSAGGAPATGRRDVRPWAFAIAVSAIVLVGVVLSLFSASESPRTVADALLAGIKPVDQASHVAAKRREETELRFQQGVVMLHAKEYDHAVTAFHRVLELSPEMPEAHVNMGYALIGLRRWAAARDFFESAIALRPDQLNAYFGLAEALEGLGDLPGAIGAMRTYVHLAAPDDPFRRKGESALWEWQDRLARERAAAPPAKGTPNEQRNASKS
jgi:hypothetical protein